MYVYTQNKKEIIDISGRHYKENWFGEFENHEDILKAGGTEKLNSNPTKVFV